MTAVLAATLPFEQVTVGQVWMSGWLGLGWMLKDGEVFVQGLMGSNLHQLLRLMIVSRDWPV